MQITVYSKPACVQCTATHTKIGKLGLDELTTTIDISEDAEARDFAMGLGYMQAPVVTVRDSAGALVSHWSGYSPDNLKLVADNLAAA